MSVKQLQEMQIGFAWYLKDHQCCAVKRLSSLISVGNLVELKSIERNISSIESKINRI